MGKPEPQTTFSNASEWGGTITYEMLKDAVDILKNISPIKPEPRFIENRYMEEHVQYSRSPSRAKRRAKKGHPQHFIMRPIRNLVSVDGVTYFGHPDTIRLMMKEISYVSA